MKINLIPLQQLQDLILGAVLGTATDEATSLVGPAINPAARLAVYRNTVRSNFAAALESTFPAVRRLVGDGYFRRLAQDFAGRHPSRSGDLRHVGASFPAYLAAIHAHDQYCYLGEVARLELLIEEVLLAPEHPPLDLTVLAAVPSSAYERLQFVLNPALRLFESPYPIKRIWESNVGSDAEPDAIDLESGAERFTVLRRRLQLQFHGLSLGEWRWLTALHAGMPFAASLDAAVVNEGEVGGDFDPTAALQRFVALGAIVDVRCWDRVKDELMSFLDVVIAPSTLSARVLNPLQSLFALGVRCYVSLQFFRAGYLKYTDWPATLNLFATEYHVSWLEPYNAAVAGTVCELFFPTLMLIGLYTRLSAIGIFAMNVMAVVVYRQTLLAAGFEAALGQRILWGTLILFVIIYGPSKLSIDHLLNRARF